MSDYLLLIRHTDNKFYRYVFLFILNEIYMIYTLADLLEVKVDFEMMLRDLLSVITNFLSMFIKKIYQSHLKYVSLKIGFLEKPSMYWNDSSFAYQLSSTDIYTYQQLKRYVWDHIWYNSRIEYWLWRQLNNQG